MEDFVMVMWRMKDGRNLPFNHPEALAARCEAIKHLKGVYPEMPDAYYDAAEEQTPIPEEQAPDAAFVKPK